MHVTLLGSALWHLTVKLGRIEGISAEPKAGSLASI